MSARQLARISNEFQMSARSIPVELLLSNGEAAALLGLTRWGVRQRARRMNLTPLAVMRSHPGKPSVAKGQGCVMYWTRQQIEQLRSKS